MEQKLKDYAVTKLLEEGLLCYFGNDDIIKSSESNIIIFIRENRETEIVKSISYAACLLYCKFEIDYNNLSMQMDISMMIIGWECWNISISLAMQKPIYLMY